MAEPIQHRVPTNQAEAEQLLARFAFLSDAVQRIENQRATKITEANRLADEAGAALVAERELIRIKLEPWWKRAGEKLIAALSGGKGKPRKSVVLMGCKLGCRTAPAKLEITGDEAAIVAALMADKKLGKGLVVTKHVLDKRAVLAALDDALAPQLEALGLSRGGGGEDFVLERAEQGGVLAGLAA